ATDTVAHAGARPNAHGPDGPLHADPRSREGGAGGSCARRRAMECIARGGPGDHVGADPPSRHPPRESRAGYLLPGLPHQSRDRYTYRGPPPARVRGKPRAWPAVFMVSGLGPDARNNRLACLPACCWPERIERIGPMCGRFSQRYTWREIRNLHGLTGAARNLQAHYNIAPTDPADVVKSRDGGANELVSMRWGLIPYWWKKPLKHLPAT